MTPAEFTATVARTRMRPEGRGTQGARLVLSEGLSNAEAARRVGSTPEAIRQAAQRVRAAYRDMQGLPAHWACLTVALPADRETDLREAVSALGGRVL